MASVDHYHCKQRIFEWLQTVLCGICTQQRSFLYNSEDDNSFSR